MIQCEICKREFSSFKSLSIHASQAHGLKAREYYLKFRPHSPEAGTCKGCTAPTEFLSIEKGFRPYCSTQCASSDSACKAKRAATNLERYGAKCSLQNSEVKRQSEATTLERYGVRNASQAAEVREKVKHTLTEKYGIESVGQGHAVFKAKIAQSNLQKYGVENVAQAESVKAKMAQTCLERYGVRNVSLRREKFAESYAQRLAEFDCEFVGFAGSTNLVFKCNRCGTLHTADRGFSFSDRTSRGITPCVTCAPLMTSVSNGEASLREYISTLVPPAELKFNDRSVLDGRELDIFIPALNLAVEYDGLYWHCAERLADNRYHLTKTEECATQGIELIHIFEDEWTLKRPIVESRLRSKFHLSSRVYARQCTAVEVTERTVVSQFISDTHIQGPCTFRYAYGLMLNAELVAVMTFGQSRFNSSEFELLRYSSKLNVSVTGGAGKLLAAFHKAHPEISAIVSYADRRWSSGNLYKSLGFSLESVSSPSYDYTNFKSRFHRLNFQRHKLVNAYADTLGDIEGMTEAEITAKLGLHRIYNCGQYKFIKEF